MQAILTGDLIDSTKYEVTELDMILNVLNEEFNAIVTNEEHVDFKIFRGDSFQGIAIDASRALYLALAIKTALNRLHLQNKKISGLPDLRIAIGIGAVNLKRESILESNGEAFQFSGKTLDTMKGDYPRLLLKTADDNLNDEFNVHFSFLDSVTSKWSKESAEVAYYLLRGYKEREIAEELGIYQSAVNQRKKAANWDSISLLLKRYRFAINHFVEHGS